MALAGLLAEVRRTGGLVGSVLRYPDGRYQQVGSRISLWTGRIRGLPEQALYHGMPIPYLCGGSVLAPTAVLKQLQGFDPNYFLYFEDADLTQRARQAGLPVTLALDSVVFHVEGGTTGKTSDLTRYYFQRNRLRFSWQYAKGLQKVTLLLYTLVRLARAWLKQGKTRPNLDITAILDFFNNDLRFFADADAAPKSPGFGRR
jgi:GT2 family glycosyltransferase